MISAKFICVGKMKEMFYMEAFKEYSKRLSSFCSFECCEISECRLSDNPSDKEIQQALMKEALLISASIPKNSYIIPLCVEGKQISSEQFADLVNNCELSGHSRICFIIGGSYGLADTIKQKADFKLSMSRMTFPHHLARVILAEQFYRSFKILEGSKYHK